MNKAHERRRHDGCAEIRRRQPTSKIITQRPLHIQKSDARPRHNTIIGSGVKRRRAYPTNEASAGIAAAAAQRRQPGSGLWSLAPLPSIGAVRPQRTGCPVTPEATVS
jgi:hypothetical protein